MQIVAVIFTILHPLALVSSALSVKLHGRRDEGALRLPDDDEEDAPRARGPREVDAEALWG